MFAEHGAALASNDKDAFVVPLVVVVVLLALGLLLALVIRKWRQVTGSITALKNPFPAAPTFLHENFTLTNTVSFSQKMLLPVQGLLPPAPDNGVGMILNPIFGRYAARFSQLL